MKTMKKCDTAMYIDCYNVCKISCLVAHPIMIKVQVQEEVWDEGEGFL